MSSVSTIPEPLAQIAADMSSFPRWWALCGGWAVDAWLGRVTREHGDIDVTVFFDDERAVFQHFAGWNVVAHDGANPVDSEPWDGRILVRRSDVAAHLHARPPGEDNREALLRWVTPPHKADPDDRNIEVVFNDLEGDDWLLRDSPRVTIRPGDAVRTSPWGLPTVTPEVVAFFKAAAYYRHERLWGRPQDISDFELLVPLLNPSEREWLRNAIATVHTDHPWLALL